MAGYREDFPPTALGGLLEWGIEREREREGEREDFLHLHENVRPDTELARRVVARRMLLAGERYHGWGDSFKRVSLGVLLMSTTRDINMHEMLHFLHLSQGSTHLRPHAGQTFLYDNGAFRLFNGVMRESVLQRCREYDELSEWRLWCLAKKPVPREDAEILQAIGFLFRAIAESSRNAPSADLEDTGVAPWRAAARS